MDIQKVFIENLPPPEAWYTKWIPISIALCSFAVAVYSLYLSRKQDIDSSRPFVSCLTNYLFIGNSSTPQFERTGILSMKVLNAPAKIEKLEIEFYRLSRGRKVVLHSSEEPVQVRFPIESSEWTYTYAVDLAQNVKECKPGDILELHVRIEYTALSGGKTYEYESSSRYDLEGKTWRSINEKAS